MLVASNLPIKFSTGRRRKAGMSSGNGSQPATRRREGACGCNFKLRATSLSLGGKCDNGVDPFALKRGASLCVSGRYARL